MENIDIDGRLGWIACKLEALGKEQRVHPPSGQQILSQKRASHRPPSLGKFAKLGLAKQVNDFASARRALRVALVVAIAAKAKGRERRRTARKIWQSFLIFSPATAPNPRKCARSAACGAENKKPLAWRLDDRRISHTLGARHLRSAAWRHLAAY